MYAVQHNTLISGWVNTWSTINLITGVVEPKLFRTRKQATRALEEFLQDTEIAAGESHLAEPYLRAEFRIIKV